MVTILVTDLLTGVLTGVLVSLLKLLRDFCKLDILRSDNDGRIVLKLIGAATFLSMPKLSIEIEKLPPSTQLHIDLSELSYIDHACLELLMSWEQQYTKQGGTLTFDWGRLQARFKSTSTPMSQSGAPDANIVTIIQGKPV